MSDQLGRCPDLCTRCSGTSFVPTFGPRLMVSGEWSTPSPHPKGHLWLCPACGYIMRGEKIVINYTENSQIGKISFMQKCYDWIVRKLNR